MQVSTVTQESLGVSIRRFAPVLAPAALISTILLVAMGSIVRVTGNGLGCPDWPLCYGRVIPPALTGAWVEFTHRFLGGVTSLLILSLGVTAWRGYRDRPWVFRPALAAVGLLAVQVVLGGLHVIFEIPPVTGWIHTGVAMLIVGMVTVQAVNLMPLFQRLHSRAQESLQRGVLPLWVSVNAGAAFLLLLSGSYVTRSGASLACPSFPWCGANTPAIRRLIEIQMLHRYAAFTVAFLTLVTVIWLLVRQRERGLAFIAYGLLGLLIVQFGLGIANVLLRLPMWSRVLHLTVGATFWAGLVLLWTLCYAHRPVAEAHKTLERSYELS